MRLTKVWWDEPACLDARPAAAGTAFVAAMQHLGFGRFESVRIERGELVLNPWPATVRGVKFGSEESAGPQVSSDEFELKRQVVEFFEYVRAVDAGEIRCLELRHGLPFSMEIEHRPNANGGRVVERFSSSPFPPPVVLPPCGRRRL